MYIVIPFEIKLVLYVLAVWHLPSPPQLFFLKVDPKMFMLILLVQFNPKQIINLYMQYVERDEQRGANC
jgi:hypothetical protein